MTDWEGIPCALGNLGGEKWKEKKLYERMIQESSYMNRVFIKGLEKISSINSCKHRLRNYMWLTINEEKKGFI